MAELNELRQAIAEFLAAGWPTEQGTTFWGVDLQKLAKAAGLPDPMANRFVILDRIR